MDCYIKQMVTKNIKLIKMIVKGNWKKRNKTARIEIPNVLQIMDISYSKIINDINIIIKMKWAMKSIRIDDNS